MSPARPAHKLPVFGRHLFFTLRFVPKAVSLLILLFFTGERDQVLKQDQSFFNLKSQLALSVFLNTHMSWVYDHYRYVCPFSAGTVFIRQDLTSTDVRS